METLELQEEIRKSYDELDEAIAEQNLLKIKTLLNDMAVQDISDYLEEQKDEDVQATLFRLLKKDVAVEVFEHLEFDEQEILINSLKHERIIEILEEMEPDDRTELFEEMPASVVKKYISHLSAEERLKAVRLLGYPDDSVGRLMTTEYVAFRADKTVREAVDYLKEVAPDKETIYHCYIIDKARELIGYCSLKMMFLAQWEDKLKDIMVEDVVSLPATEDQEAAARLFKHYDLLALPIVDGENRLVGIVTFDDLVDVLEEEATEDIQKMAAILPEEHPYFDSGIFMMAGKRILWLSILLVAQVFSGLIMRGYEHALDAVVALAFFIPMLLATGGNTGAQSSAMVIRGLAVGEIRMKNIFAVIGKEMLTGLLLGMGLCLLGLASSFLMLQDSGLMSDAINLNLLPVVLGISISLTVVFAAIIGGTLPMIFKAMNLDPALMSGPFITTLVDISGLLIYFETFKLFFPA